MPIDGRWLENDAPQPFDRDADRLVRIAKEVHRRPNEQLCRPHVARLAEQDGAWLDVDRHEGLHADPATLVVRVESALFFANGDHVRDRIEALRTPATRIVVLDAETSPFVDITAAEMLAQLAVTLRRDGIELRIARDIGQFRDVMRSAVPEAFHHEVFRTIDEALTGPAMPPDAPDPLDLKDPKDPKGQEPG